MTVEVKKLMGKEVRKGMNKRWVTILTVVFTGCIFLAVGALTAADVPADIKIQNTGYKEDKKGAVKFSHGKHSKEYKAPCAECHHVYKDGKNVFKEGDPVDKCSKCHAFDEKKGNADKLQNAYHKNCKNCHKEFVEKNPNSKAPFQKCNDCHEGKS